MVRVSNLDHLKVVSNTLRLFGYPEVSEEWQVFLNIYRVALVMKPPFGGYQAMKAICPSPLDWNILFGPLIYFLMPVTYNVFMEGSV